LKKICKQNSWIFASRESSSQREQTAAGLLQHWLKLLLVIQPLQLARQRRRRWRGYHFHCHGHAAAEKRAATPPS
jgi:hypothetical protein